MQTCFSMYRFDEAAMRMHHPHVQWNNSIARQ